MKNYKQTASDVLRMVGGEKNVVQVEHCSTRLRFTLADTSKVDAAALKKTAGVMGVISSGPQCQVVIGNDVIEVYDELLKLGTFNAGQAAAPAAPKGKKEIGGIILDYMVGIFQPLVPAIAGAGVLKALMVLLSTLGLMSSGDIAYKVFVGVADAALYYLPVMVAFTTATKFNCNKLVSVALAAAMIHPSVSALLATEGGAYFLGIKLQNIAYRPFCPSFSCPLLRSGPTSGAPRPSACSLCPCCASASASLWHWSSSDLWATTSVLC